MTNVQGPGVQETKALQNHDQHGLWRDRCQDDPGDRLFWGSYSKHAQDLGTSARSFKIATPPSVSAVNSETNLAGRLPPSQNLPVIVLLWAGWDK